MLLISSRIWCTINFLLSDDWTVGGHFFWTEFTVNYIIATYSKPQVTLYWLYWAFHRVFVESVVWSVFPIFLFYLIRIKYEGLHSQWHCHGRWRRCFRPWEISSCYREFSMTSCSENESFVVRSVSITSYNECCRSLQCQKLP